MQTSTIQPAPAAGEVAVPGLHDRPVSVELGADLTRLEHEQQIVLDRQRQEELARLRAVQTYD